MVFGTFDGLHEGHLYFFRQARQLAVRPFLIVSVARDSNVERIKKNLPVWSERRRMQLVKKCSLVDKVVLAGIRAHLPHILKERPSVIALGYDQKAYVQNLKKDLQNKGLFVKIIRLKSHKPKQYKNHLRKIRP